MEVGQSLGSANQGSWDQTPAQACTSREALGKGLASPSLAASSVDRNSLHFLPGKLWGHLSIAEPGSPGRSSCTSQGLERQGLLLRVSQPLSEF